MLLTLQQRGRLTAAELAAHLEVSIRTVLRDVEALSGAGIPIYSVPGVGGGIDLVEGFRTRLTGLSTGEAAAVMLAGQPKVAHRLGLSVDAVGARRKLIEALPGEQRPVVERIDHWFIHDPDPWAGHRIPHGELRRLARAIADRVEAELVFAESRRVVRPVGLVLKAGSWYLIDAGVDAAGVDAAGLAAEPLVVGIDRLRSTRITRQHFPPADNFNLAEFWDAFVAQKSAMPRPIGADGGVVPVWGMPR